MKDRIIHLISTTCGGAVQFHALDNLCLRVNDRKELEMVTWDPRKNANRYTPFNRKGWFRRILKELETNKPL